MTQNTPEDSDKREAASFFKKWMSNSTEGSQTGNWDEVCLQWCKQKDAARQGQADPSCKMYCFRRPVTQSKGEQLNETKSWNPLSGYKIVVVDGVEECVTHVKDMKSITEQNTEGIKTARYELDLGNVWTEAKGGAKYVLDEKVKPLYNSSVEQAKEQANEWKKSPEAQQLKDYVQQQADRLYTQIFQTSPPTINTVSPPEPMPKPDDSKK